MRTPLNHIRRSAAAAPGFSLVELLVTVSIMTMLAVLGGIAVAGIMKSNQITRGGQLLSEQVSLARQEAVSRNKDVQVIFLDTDEDVPGWEAMQVRTIDVQADGQREVPISNVAVLPSGVTVTDDATYTKILSASSTLQGNYVGGAYDGAKYTGFIFRSSGSLEGTIVAGQNYLTVVDRNSAPPHANYYTIQINPVTGSVQVYRP